MRPIEAIGLQYNPICDMIQAMFSINSGDVEKLYDALKRGELLPGKFELWDGDDHVWFSGTLYYDKEWIGIDAQYETGEIVISVNPEYDPLDHTAPVNIEHQWITFVKPLKRILEILQ